MLEDALVVRWTVHRRYEASDSHRRVRLVLVRHDLFTNSAYTRPERRHKIGEPSLSQPIAMSIDSQKCGRSRFDDICALACFEFEIQRLHGVLAIKPLVNDRATAIDA